MTDVNWNAAPPWARWWAVDANGIAYWHAQRPRIQGDAWHSRGAKSVAGMVYLSSVAMWRWSLVEREMEAVG